MLLVGEKRILVVAQGREKSRWSDRSGQDLVCRWSDDLGETWSEVRRIVEHGNHSIVPNAAVYDGVRKRVHVLYNVFEWDYLEPPTRTERGKQRCQQFQIWSDDGGETWTKPRNITDMIGIQTATVVFGSGEGIQLRRGKHAGRLVVPGGHFKGRKHVLCYLSDDHGETWRRGESVPLPEGMKVQSETKVAELPDGRLILNNRATPRRRQAYSEDGGVSWSTMRDVEAIKAPSCNGSLVSVDDEKGNPLLLCSAPAGPGRTHGTIWISRDQGASRPHRVEIVPDAFAYSSLVVLPDRRIGLFYEARGHLDIRLVKIPLGRLSP